MSVELTVTLSDAQVSQLAVQVADLLEDRAEPDEPSEWLRGAKAAAEYMDCPESRVYDLVARGELPHFRDGSVLVFRRQDLDDYYLRSPGVS